MGKTAEKRYVLAFDTANEVIACGLGLLDAENLTVRPVAELRVSAHRSSNTQLLARIDDVLADAGVTKNQLACVAVGRGPGSFTGVRICMATAKGTAQSLGVGLVALSTLDAIAWGVQSAGERGNLLVAADAMRKEVYPVRYLLEDAGVTRLEPDRVVKADAAAAEYSAGADACASLLIAGDALVKYAALFEGCGRLLDDELWNVSGAGLLAALEAAWRAGEADPFDAARHNPAFALPVYTRLSDAEENERARLAKNDEKDLVTGVQGSRATMHKTAVLASPANGEGIVYRPLDEASCEAVAKLEACVMPAGAWSARMVADELPQKTRTWWAAFASVDPTPADPADFAPAVEGNDHSEHLIGYAGGMICGDELEILRVGVDPAWRRRGIARELLSRVASDARDLGASRCLLEVRAGNDGAHALYTALGLADSGVRPRYYSDGEDAQLMEGPLPIMPHDVGGMTLVQHDENEVAPHEITRPLILALESSCDETAAAIVDGAGNLVADVVASQIDFHARFGGVVPEIASRKHIEAICGLCDECFDVAAAHLGVESLTWGDLDAVGATYAPGLVGALVVGVAFAKGAAWAHDLPFIGVNHLEGHLYANKIGAPDIEPPMVASLVSGGNTMLVHVRDWGSYETLGATIDDAVGEAFDKVAKALGLGYPGGPRISRYGEQGNPRAIAFPRAMMHSGDLRFSLSGLKTAVVSYINAEREAGRTLNIPDICASFEAAVVDVQVSKAIRALEQTGARTFCLGGGVAANPVLRAAYQKMCAERGIRLVMPPLRSCGDNAGMIALVALERFKQKKFFDYSADAYARADLDKPY